MSNRIGKKFQITSFGSSHGPAVGAVIDGCPANLKLSTDDIQIADVAASAGADVPFLRPVDLSGDDSSVIDAIAHVHERIPGYDLIILLQPTSPFRNVHDIDQCIEMMDKHNVPSVVSVVEPDKSPYWSYQVSDNGTIKRLLDNYNVPRQKLPKTVTLNGAIYVADMEWLLEHNGFVSEDTMCYEMPHERSIDIDSEFDFWLCEKMLEDRKL